MCSQTLNQRGRRSINPPIGKRPVADLARTVQFKRAKDQPANCPDNSGNAKALRITQPRVGLVTALFLKELVVPLSNPVFNGLRSLVGPEGQREAA